MKPKRWVLMEVPENATESVVRFYNESRDLGWETIHHDRFLTGPVALMQAATKEADARLDYGIVAGEYFFDDACGGWIKATRDFKFTSPRFVIPAPEPEGECKDCQGIKPGESIRHTYDEFGDAVCWTCERHYSEWTYAEPDNVMTQCPFCGNIDRLWECWQGDRCHVMCAQCEALGPAGSSWEEAKRKWDERRD